MSQFLFGSGILWGTPLTDANSNAIANPSPVQFGTLQDCSIDMSFDTKMLYGQNQFPVAVGRGKGKMSGKAKIAQVNGMLYNSIFFGQTLSAGTLVSDVYDTTGAAIPATPYTITVTPPGSGAWSRDLGVKNANGVPMTCVAGTPTTGQYAVTAGAYLFAAADTGLTVYISYQYTATSAGAKKLVIANLPMGYAPTFKTDLLLPYQGKSLVLTLGSCVGSKLSMATKQDDFAIPEFDFDAFADSNGNIGTLAWSE